jgi:hypothetical protein
VIEKIITAVIALEVFAAVALFVTWVSLGPLYDLSKRRDREQE